MSTVGMVSLGCAKNRVDSEVLLGMLKGAGHEIVSDPAEAEIIFVNTCGFIEPAKEESIEAIFEMARYKQTGRLKKLFVTGCLAQRYMDDLYREMPEVDGFMGVADYARLPEMLREAQAGGRPRYMRDGERFFKAPRVLTTPPYSAYVKISDGCDNRCSYCAIPLIRGPYRSRPFESIVEECRALAAGGVTEITLIAQDTSRYGNDFPGGRTLLPELLKAVSDIEGVHWLRVLYLYPDTTDDRLLDAIARLPKVAPYVDSAASAHRRRHAAPHEPPRKRRVDQEPPRGLQGAGADHAHHDDRRLSRGDSRRRSANFSGLCKETRFDRLGAFAYSPEEGTPGAEMPDQIDEAVKRRRLDELMTLQQGISLERNQERVGEVCEVLCEGMEEGMYTGRSIREAPESDGAIRFTAGREIAPGEYIRVKITGAEAYDLYGEVYE